MNQNNPLVWAHRAQTIMNLQVAKFATWFGWCGSLRPAPFLPFGTMYRNNIKKISILFRNFLTLFRKHIFAGFSSYQKDNLISCAHFAHLICYAMWAGSQRPTPKSMGRNDHLIFLRNNTEKSRWFCSAYCSEYSSDKIRKASTSMEFSTISLKFVFCN